MTLEVNSDNILQVKYNDNILEEKTIVGYSSSKYNLKNDYIYVGQETFDFDSITVINCEKSIEHLVYTIFDSDRLQITYNDQVIYESEIISYQTDYDVIDNYLYLGTDIITSNTYNSKFRTSGNLRLNRYSNGLDYNNFEIYNFNNSKKIHTIYITSISRTSDYNMNNNFVYIGSEGYNENKLKINHGYAVATNDKLEIYDERDVLRDERKLVSITSDYYEINEEEGYIYTGYEVFDLSKLNRVNCTIEAYDTYINVMYNNEVIKTYNLISIISPSKYDLNNEYIYIKNTEFELDRIRTINCDKGIDENNNLVITYNGNEIIRKPIIRYETDYEIMNNSIYLGTNGFDSSRFNVINGTIDNGDIYYFDILLDTILLLSISSDYYDLTKDYINIEASVLYLEYINKSSDDITL